MPKARFGAIFCSTLAGRKFVTVIYKSCRAQFASTGIATLAPVAGKLIGCDHNKSLPSTATIASPADGGVIFKLTVSPALYAGLSNANSI